MARIDVQGGDFAKGVGHLTLAGASDFATATGGRKPSRFAG